MKRLLILFAAGLALAACDSDIQPTKAPGARSNAADGFGAKAGNRWRTTVTGAIIVSK